MKPLYYSCIISFLLFIGSNSCFGQAQNQEVTPYTALYPFEENGLYGLIDSVGRVVIEAQFSQILRADVFKLELSTEELNEDLEYRQSEQRKSYENSKKWNRTIQIKHRKSILPEVSTSQSKLLFLPFKNNAYYFLKKWAVVRIDDIYGYINYKGEIRINANDASKTIIRNSSANTIRYNWELAEEKTNTKIEGLHPNKYAFLRPVINYPNLIIVHQNIDGTNTVGLIKLDTLKNKTETIIPVNKGSIEYDFREGFIKVKESRRTRLFNLSEETFLDIATEKSKTKVEQLHPNKYERIFPVIDYPHLIVVYQRINGTRTSMSGLLKLDTLKNKTETIIPIKKNNILHDFYDGVLEVIDNQGTRLFDLSGETYLDIAEHEIKTKIELLHPNKYKYQSLEPVKNYPHLIIVNQIIDGTRKYGLLKFDTLKNKTETIIPINKRSIRNDEHVSLLEVSDEKGTRLFNLLEETFLEPAKEKRKKKIDLQYPTAGKVNNRWGVLDTLGNWLYPPQLEHPPIYRKDLVHITSNEKRFYLQGNGQLIHSDFELMGPFSNQPNLFLFHLNGQYGIINTVTKDTVLAPIYDDFHFDYENHYGAGKRYNGAIKVIKNNKSGLVNLEGKLIAPCIYTYVSGWTDPLKTRKRNCFTVVINNKTGLIDQEGNKILAPKYDKIQILNKETYAFKKGEKWGYVYLREDLPVNEKKIVAPKYTTIRGGYENLIHYTTKGEQKEKTLHLASGTIIQDLDLFRVTSLNDALLLFQNARGQWGIYNIKTQKVIVPPTYNYGGKISNQRVALMKNRKYSIFNYRTGVFIHKNKFDDITLYTSKDYYSNHKAPSSYSSCIAFKIDNKWGLMNAKEKIILEAKAQKIPRLNEENLFEIQINNHNYLVDTTGKIVLTTEIKKAPTGYGSCIPFKEDNLWGLKNAEGEIIFDAEFRYWPKLNKQNLFELYIDGRFHLLDSVGKIVLATDFTEIIPLMTGKTEVRFRTDSNLWGIADSNYKVIFHPQFEEFKYKDNWIIQAQKQGKWYWLKPDFTLGDTDSTPKFKPNGYPTFGYDLAFPYNYNLNSPYFTVIKNDKRGLIDTLGKELISPEYDRIYLFSNTLAVVQKEKKYGLLNFQTNTLQQPMIFDKYEWRNQQPFFTIKPKKGYINYQGEFVWKEALFDFTPD